MSACKVCNKEVGDGHWERTTVVKRDPKPSDYFQVPTRTWLLQSGSVQVYMHAGALYCKPCFDKQEAAV